MAEVDMRDEEAVASDPSSPDVANKYREAASAVNTVLAALAAYLEAYTQATPLSVADVCAHADEQLEGLLSKAYKTKKGMAKGVAFPTCVSANERVCHYSPLKAESGTIAPGDCVKIDMGAHIDGFIAVAAHTCVVGSGTSPITGRRADAMAAAYAAAEVALRVLRPGARNADVTEAMRRVFDAYGVNPAQGVLMHELKHWTIDGPKVILLRGDDPEIKVDEAVFQLNEVYSVDVVVSTGEGKPREGEARTTVFKRSPETDYGLKMKASRALVGEVMRRFQTMPFTLRALESEASARMGVVEATKHGVLIPYPVLEEKPGAEVAHVKFTAMLLPGGTLKLAGLSAPTHTLSDKALPADIAAAIAAPAYVSKKDKKDKARKPATAAVASDEVDMRDA